MSTMREQFEAWQREQQGWLYTEEVEPGTFQEDRWIAWQAATEAAKATGTAGELLPLPLGIGSGLYFTVDQMREYGQACAEAARIRNPKFSAEDIEAMIQGRAAEIAAARQPAQVVAVKPWKERQHLMDGVTDRLSDKECLSLAEAEITDLRAALAATAAPVLSDEQIFKIHDQTNDADSQILAFARAIIAATNRSQP